MMRLKSKVAIITGAKSGIGRATAARFAAEGAKVVAADIRDSRPQVLELTERGAEACFIQADVARSRQVEVLIQQTIGAYGRLDILVNNAGIELTNTIAATH